MNKKILSKISLWLLISTCLLSVFFVFGLSYLNYYVFLGFFFGVLISPILLASSIILSIISLEKGKNKVALVSLIISSIFLLVLLGQIFFGS